MAIHFSILLVTFVISYFWFLFLLPGSFLVCGAFIFFVTQNVTPISENLVVSGNWPGIINWRDRCPRGFAVARRRMAPISIFMNVFDVHVNRASYGEVIATPYHNGQQCQR